MKKAIFALVLLGLLLSAAVVRGGCSTCDGDYPWNDDNDGVTTSSATSSLASGLPFTFNDAKPYLEMAAATAGMLLASLFLAFAWLSGNATRGRKKRAFKWGFIPAVFFFMQSLFCVGLGFLLNCTLSVITSGFGLVLGVIFYVYTVYVLAV